MTKVELSQAIAGKGQETAPAAAVAVALPVVLAFVVAHPFQAQCGCYFT